MDEQIKLIQQEIKELRQQYYEFIKQIRVYSELISGELLKPVPRLQQAADHAKVITNMVLPDIILIEKNNLAQGREHDHCF